MIFPKNYNTCLQPPEPINQKSFCETVSDKIKDAYGNAKSFAKGKLVIFGLICFGCISLLIIIISIPIALSKNKKNSNPIKYSHSPDQNSQESLFHILIKMNIPKIYIQMNVYMKK